MTTTTTTHEPSKMHGKKDEIVGAVKDKMGLRGGEEQKHRGEAEIDAAAMSKTGMARGNDHMHGLGGHNTHTVTTHEGHHGGHGLEGITGQHTGGHTTGHHTDTHHTGGGLLGHGHHGKETIVETTTTTTGGHTHHH